MSDVAVILKKQREVLQLQLNAAQQRKRNAQAAAAKADKEVDDAAAELAAFETDVALLPDRLRPGRNRDSP